MQNVLWAISAYSVMRPALQEGLERDVAAFVLQIALLNTATMSVNVFLQPKPLPR